MEDTHRDEARNADDEQLRCPSVNAEKVDTVAASAVEVSDFVVVVVEGTHCDEERDEDDGQTHRPTISEERVATVAVSAIEVADAVIVDEDTHYNKAKDNEGDCFWNYDNDDEVLEVDDVNGTERMMMMMMIVRRCRSNHPSNNQHPTSCRSRGVIRLSRHISQVSNKLEI